MGFEGLSQGKNSVLFGSDSDGVLYEKLSNTIHVGSRERLEGLQEKVECFSYEPTFEGDSLKQGATKNIGGLVLGVTERCNLRCSYCIYSGNYENERGHGSEDMDFDIARRAVDLYIPNSEQIAMISFYGGEPTLNMNLIKKVIKYTNESYPEKRTLFSMTSNFYRVETHLQDIINAGMNVLVSIDGPQEVHDRNRVSVGGNPTWENILRNIRRMEELSPGYTRGKITASVSCAEPCDVAEVVNYFRNSLLPVSRIGGIETRGLEKKMKDKLNQARADFSEEYLQTLIQGDDPDEVISLLFDQDVQGIQKRSSKTTPETLMLNGACYPGKRKVYIDIKGKLFMCEKFGDRLSIGDVFNGFDQEAIGESIDRFTEIRNRLCTNGCWAQRLCSPCIQTAKDPQGDISEEGLSEHCKPTKQRLARMVYVYATLAQQNPGKLKEHLEQVDFV